MQALKEEVSAGSAALLARLRAVEAPVTDAALGDPLVIVRGRGAHLWDADGKRYLDLSASKTAVNVGHCHPAVVAAVQQQAGRLLYHLSGYVSEARLEFTEALAAAAPAGLSRVALALSGSDAVWLAIKASLIATERRRIVTFTGAHHGRGVAVLPFSGVRHPVESGFAGAIPVDVAPFPHPYQPQLSGASDGGEERLRDACLAELDRLMGDDPDGQGPPAAVLLEPVQGKGGVVVPPAGFLSGVRELCDRHGAVMIADEVQSGVGRVGQLWASTIEGCTPDLLAVGKALGGGLGVAAVLGREAVLAAIPPGVQGGTFLTNPVNLAAGAAALDVLITERLAERSARLGVRARERCDELLSGSPCVGHIRGRGLMLGIELDTEDHRPEMATELAAGVRRFCRDRGVLVHTSGPRRSVLKLTPPLVIEESELDRGIDLIAEAIATICR